MNFGKMVNLSQTSIIYSPNLSYLIQRIYLNTKLAQFYRMKCTHNLFLFTCILYFLNFSDFNKYKLQDLISDDIVSPNSSNKTATSPKMMDLSTLLIYKNIDPFYV